MKSNQVLLLKKLVYEGARNKNLDITDTVLDRIYYELSVIESKGFSNYFIIYSRIIEICNELNLLRSYGRGSAANSLVNYCLDITKINPIVENFIFERFIHPQQKHLPDIDIDIPKGHQKKVIENLKQKHPEYHTYFIAFSPQIDTDYQDVVYNNIIYKKHPCGIIITTEKIAYSVFLYEEQEFYLVTDTLNDPLYNNKFDILELEYLNRLQLIVDEIGEEYHPYKLPLNDKKVFEFFASGDLENIFQFNSPPLKGILSRFIPNSINDLSIINAMFRPGLVQYIPTITWGKFNNVELSSQGDKRVSEILKETYGLLIYQETFLHILNRIAGMTFSEAELWRKKIMINKSSLEVDDFRTIFSNGCSNYSSLSEIEIASLTNMITGMLPILFQKAHALSYAIIGYWGGYYKTYFKRQFEKAFKSDLNFQKFELF